MIDPYTSATELVGMLQAGEISSVELCTATLDRIDQVNPVVNAIVSSASRETVLAEAAKSDQVRASGAEVGPLHGLPMAIKDLCDVIGFRTSHGSLVMPESPAQIDDIFVERLRKAGVIFIGKTNTPEFGTGCQTFNEVFGTTLNAYDASKVSGGSSGGAAVALATGMVSIADGSDLGGSLRNPAAFNNVIGFRPSIGRVPRLKLGGNFHPRMGLEGPMGRSVEDVGLLLSVQAGPDARDARSLADPGEVFGNPVAVDPANLRVAWGGDMGLLFQTEILEVCRASLAAFADGGAVIEEALPDLSTAMNVFRVHRGIGYRRLGAAVPEDKYHLMKQTVRENVEYGRSLTNDDVDQAEIERTQLHLDVVDFFATYDVLAVPTTQVVPFDSSVEYPTEINGQPLEDYLSWMVSNCVITATGCPSVSMPAGFSESGLPIGIQLVCAPGDDLRLLQIASTFEAGTQFAKRRPELASS